MKRIKRNSFYEINLDIKDQEFIKTPRDFQRTGLINKSLKEFEENLKAIDNEARYFVPGNTNLNHGDKTHKELSEQAIMEDWQIPLMQEMTNLITETKGHILEIGFGRGISSDMIQEKGVKSHTIVECNEFVIQKFYEWKSKYSQKDIKLIEGLWQDNLEKFELYDGIFFHTYPLNEEEFIEYVSKSVTFAEHFFETASKHLRPNGAFTYFTNEIDSLSRSHQRLIFKYFSSFSLQLLDLDLPDDIKDTWWARKIAVVKAVK